MADIFAQEGITEQPKGKDIFAEEGIAPQSVQKQTKQPGGLLSSIGAGLQQDISRAQQAIGGGFMPTATPAIGKMAQVPEPDLSKVAHPGLARFTAAVAPMAIPVGGEAELAAKGGQLAERFLPQIESETANFLGRMAGKGIHGAAYMNSLDELFGNKDHGKNMLDSTLWGALSNVIPSAVAEKGFKALGSMFPRFAVKDAKKIYEKTGEIPNEDQLNAITDGLSRQTVASSKALQKAPMLHSIYHNVLPVFPMTGIMKEHKNLTDNLEGDAIDKFNGWLKDAPSKDYEVRSLIANNIAANGKTLKDKASNLYENVYGKADAQNINLKPKNLANYKKEIMDEVGELNPAQQRAFKKVLGADSLKYMGVNTPIEDIPAAALEKYAQIGDLKPNVSLKELAGLRSKWGKAMASTSDLSQKRVWGGLINNLDQDMSKSLEDQGTPQLFNDYKKANQFYKENVVPYYHDNGISNVMFNKIDLNSNTLEKELSDTRNKKVLDDLSNDDKSRLSRLLIKPNIPDNGEDAAGRIVKAYKDLSDHQKDNIVTPEIKKDITGLNERRVKLDPVYRSVKKTFMKNIWDMHKVGWTARMLGLGVLGMTHHLVNPITISALAAAPIMAKAMRKGVMRHLGEGVTEKASKAIMTEKQLSDRRKLANLTSKGLMAYHLGGQQ